MLASLPDNCSVGGSGRFVLVDDDDDDSQAEVPINSTRKSGRSSKAKKSAGDIARAKRRKMKQRLKRGMPFRIGEREAVEVAAQN